MRTGPFAHPRIIELLNHYFVPVYATNEDYREGIKPTEEISARQRIMRAAANQDLSVGSVHVYLLDADGELHQTMHVHEAANLATLHRLLTDAIQALGPTRGEVLCKPKPQSRPPRARDDEVVLRLTAREEYPRSVRPRVRIDQSVEDWIVLQPEQWRQFLPPEGGEVGTSWPIKEAVAEKIMTHLYPYAADWDNSRNEFFEKQMQARVIFHEETGGTVVAIEGQVKMLHARQPQRDPRLVDAVLLGYVRIDSESTLPHFVLTTGSATYGDQLFSAVIQSEPRAQERAGESSSTDAK